MTEKVESLRDQVEAAYEKSIEVQNSQSPSISIEHEPEPVSKTHESDREPKTHPQSDHENDLQKSEQSNSSSEITNDDSEPITYPGRFTEDDKALFDELDEKGKRLFIKRHKEMEAGWTKKAQALAEERRIAERFKKAVEPFSAHMKQAGVDEFEAFTRAASTHMALLNAPPQQRALMIQKVALDYGVDLSGKEAKELAQNIAHNQPQQHIPPEIQQLYQTVENQNAYLRNLENERQSQQYSQVKKIYDDFANAKDDSGETKYPHFEELRYDMAPLIQHGIAKSLEDAYDLALMKNKDLRAEYEKRILNNRLADEDSTKRVAASKRVSAANIKGSGNGTIIDKGPKLNLRATLDQAYESQLKKGRI